MKQCTHQKFLSFFFVFFSPLLIASPKKELPNWVDSSREKIQSPIQNFSQENLAPPASFRLLPEYAPAQAVVMGYGGFSSILNNVAQLILKEEAAEIWMNGGPSKMPGNSAKYSSVDCPINTAWMRDYGPVGIVEETGEVAIVDAIYRHYQYRVDDDRMPSCLAKKKSMATYPMNLVFDGGNLMVDNAGSLFMTKRTYNWNSGKDKDQVDNLLKDFFNVQQIHTFDYLGYPGNPVDGTGHIDMIMKLLADDKILIADSDRSDFKKVLDQHAQYFSTLTSPTGKPYQVFRMKASLKSGTWYTYTNSIIVNKLVVVPSYAGMVEENKKALEVYQAALPDYKVVLVNSDDSITSGGSFHCLTQIIPKSLNSSEK